jgi:hypothetical protein
VAGIVGSMLRPRLHEYPALGPVAAIADRTGPGWSRRRLWRHWPGSRAGLCLERSPPAQARPRPAWATQIRPTHTARSLSSLLSIVQLAAAASVPPSGVTGRSVASSMGLVAAVSEP